MLRNITTMADTIHLEIVTPERELLAADVDSVQIPGLDGELGILPGHSPLISQLKPAGLLTQAPPGIDSLELRAKRFLKIRENKPGNVYLAIIHRLDRPVSGALVHHSDRGVQYVSIKYTARLAEAGLVPSVGSIGDSYDNALAETINGLYKAEVIHRRGPWRSLEAVEYATLEWVDWFNNRRLLEPIGHVPPAEAEAAYYAALEESAALAA